MYVNTRGLTEIFIVADTIAHNVVELANHKTKFSCLNPHRFIKYMRWSLNPTKHYVYCPRVKISTIDLKIKKYQAYVFDPNCKT